MNIIKDIETIIAAAESSDYFNDNHSDAVDRVKEALKQGQTLLLDSVRQSDTANLNYDFGDLVDEYLKSL